MKQFWLAENGTPAGLWFFTTKISTQAKMPPMILPPCGAPVDANRRAELRAALNPKEVVQRIDKLINQEQVRLTEIFSDEDVHQVCDELKIEFRERDFTPAITHGLFVSQCLSRGDACSTVVTKFNRERKRQGLQPCCEDASAYWEATCQGISRSGCAEGCLWLAAGFSCRQHFPESATQALRTPPPCLENPTSTWTLVKAQRNTLPQTYASVG